MNSRTSLTYPAVFILLFVVIAAVASLLQPIDDDWFFLNYLPGAAEKWNIDGYRWFADCRLLMRDFWRPLEDVLLTAEATNPSLFPWFNHLMAVAGAFIAAAGVWSCALHIGLSRRASFCAAITLIFLANSAGAILSIDSITQTWAAAFGLWSAVAYLRLQRFRTVAWLTLGLLSCFAKETGVVFFICGPALAVITGRCKAAPLRSLLIGILPAAAFTIVYLLLRHAYQVEYPAATPEMTAVCIDGMPDWSVRILTPMHNAPASYIPTPLTLVKNIAILFLFGIWPIDTVALNYHQWLPAVATTILGLGGMSLIIMAWRQADAPARKLSLRLLGLSVVVALPSLITRAGEISSFTSNTILVMAIFALVGRMKWSIASRIALGCFLTATAITLSHKYITAYTTGERGRAMAKEIKALTPDNPQRVLWIGIDEAPLDPAGAIFTRSVYKSFNHGSAVIREYDYKAPARLDKLIIPHDLAHPATIDSLIRTSLPAYDCIWLTTPTHTKTYSLH